MCARVCACVCVQRSLQEKEKGWAGWSSWGKNLLSSATSSVGMSSVVSFHRLIFLFFSSLHRRVCLCAGQSLTSVRTKAGEALRLHRTSVGEEAQEEEEGADERREGGGESGDTDPSSSAESSASAAASGKGVFSTITHAVQNTVSENTHTHCNTVHLSKPQNHVMKMCLKTLFF